MEQQLDNLLSHLNKLEGMSAAGLVFLSCLVVGYAWRFIKLKWFANDAIPVVVIVWGAFAMSMIADARASAMPFRVWMLRNVLIGAVIGFSVWLVHDLAISRVEDWIASKLPGAKKDPSTPPPPPGTN